MRAEILNSTRLWRESSGNRGTYVHHSYCCYSLAHVLACVCSCIGMCMCAFVHLFMRACVPPEQLFFSIKIEKRALRFIALLAFEV